MNNNQVNEGRENQRSKQKHIQSYIVLSDSFVKKIINTLQTKVKPAAAVLFK